MDESALQLLLDRQAVEDTIYRYAYTIDEKDYVGLRSVFTDDVVAQYHTAPEIHGADTLVKWIDEMGVEQIFQHHLINVYEVLIDGDTAHARVYHTSHQINRNTPDTVYVIVGRYRDTLKKVDGRWLISDKRMEVGWMEQREYSQAVANEAEAAGNSAARERSGAEG